MLATVASKSVSFAKQIREQIVVDNGYGCCAYRIIDYPLVTSIIVYIDGDAAQGGNL